MVTAIGEANKIKKFTRTVTVRSPHGDHRKQNVLQRGQLRDQIISLKNDADMLGTVF